MTIIKDFANRYFEQCEKLLIEYCKDIKLTPKRTLGLEYNSVSFIDYDKVIVGSIYSISFVEEMFKKVVMFLKVYIPDDILNKHYMPRELEENIRKAGLGFLLDTGKFRIK